MTIIFFSGNLHKAREIEAIFAPFRVRIYTDFMKPFEVVECGKSFSENAKIKLNALKSAIESQGFDAIFKGEVEQKDCILMAEDSGICVESLDNFPHIFSARFANLPPLASLRDISKIAPHPVIARRSRSNPNKMDCHDSTRCVESCNDDIKDSTDSENVARLIRELKAKNLSESKAQFLSCVACCKIENSPLDSRNSPLELHSADFGIFGASQTPSLVSAPKIPKNYESQTENPSVVLNSKNTESANPPQQTIEGIAVEVLDLEKNLGAKLDLESVSLPNFSPSAKDAPKRELQTSNAQILTTHGFLNGKVITQIRGNNGFGYDPIFVPNGFESTLAEMPSTAKNALSHRKIALDLMRLILCPLSAKNLS